MGVEYCHYVLPAPGTWRPQASHLAGLIRRMKREAWVPEHVPELVRPCGDESPIAPLEPWNIEEWLKDDMAVRWFLDKKESPAAAYPLEPQPSLTDPPYWTIEIRSSPDFIHRTSEIIEPLSSTQCSCGEELEYERATGRDIFYSARIRRSCPKCGRAFIPEDRGCAYNDAWTGRPTKLPGGCVHSFALLVDCGKCHPHKPWNPRLRPALLACLTEELKCGFREVGDYC